MASSSDNDHELAAILNSHKPEGSQDSDLPAWIQAHTPVKVQIAISDDSDQATAPDRTADDASGPRAAAGAGSSKAAAGSSKAAAGSSKAAAAAAGASSKPGTNLKPAGGLVPAVAVLSSAVGEVACGEIPVILPEKLIRHKVLVELEPAPHQATELSGDAGAVARIIASAEAAADGCFKLDLKGMLYQATVLPLVGTALVANIGPTEAKIEAVMSDFVRLREESSYLEGGMLLEGGNGMTDWMADDEDNYQPGEDGKDAGAGAKQAGKKAGVAAKRKPGSKAGAGKALKLTGGVKKKPAGKKAGGKGSKTPSKGKPPKAKQPKAVGVNGKAAGAKAAAAGGKAVAAAGSAAKGKPAKKRKKQDSESEADFETDSDGGAGGDSDWSMD